MELQTVSADEVLFIHERLVTDFTGSIDPISPPGVRSTALLESAVGRQFTANGTTYKYPDPISNAATLLYGLCNDHPFHNGNKRTALVATLVHLDKNKLALFHTSKNDLYELLLQVASHTLGFRVDRRARNRKYEQKTPDEEVNFISEWLRKRADRLKRGETPITYRELRRILERFNFFLERPNNNMIEIVRYVDEKTGWLRQTKKRVRKHIGTIGWPGENRQMYVPDLKKVRKICQLCEEHGIDSDAFYTETAVIDSFVNQYRSVLRRLART